MLVLALILAACAHAHARNFNVTYLDVPERVQPGVLEVVVECRYDGNFTLLSWFKGAHEFFRYRPGAAPSTRSFPILGVGSVEMLMCGPVACQLKLGALTDEATGVYRCDIERDVPPYKFASRSAFMDVSGHEHRKPLIEGLAPEYKEDEMIQAYCKGAPDTELRWYVNGFEMENLRGSPNFKETSSRHLFIGVPPKVTIQCAEFRYGRAYSSSQQQAQWNEVGQMRRHHPKAESASSVITGRLGLLSIFLCLLDIIIHIYL
uniref:Ig-like domain-containing protein n=1 Tax=Heliothis virescens TaxID=7102 RepID=A0A2A4JS92_HELVI